MVQPVEEQNPEEPQVSRELDPEPPSSEQKLDLQPEPTVSFLFTLLSTAEPHKPKDPEEDLEIQEGQFPGKEDWGPQRTAKEINQLQNDCMRLWASLSTTQADNLALGEKLQSLVRPSSSTSFLFLPPCLPAQLSAGASLGQSGSIRCPPLGPATLCSSPIHCMRA